MGFIAGILLVLMATAHIVYGERKLLPDLATKLNDPFLLGSMRVMSVQGGMVLLSVGVLELLVAGNEVLLTGLAQYIPVGLVLVNVLTFLGVTILKHPILIKYTVPQLILFGLIVLLQLLSL